MAKVRVAVLVAGLAFSVYGVVQLLAESWGDLLHTGVWLGAGVVGHVGLRSVAVMGVGATTALILPTYTRAPVAVGLIVLGTVTLTVAPTLLGLGAEPDNPSLLDRPYGLGWLMFVGLVASAVAFTSWRARPSRRSDRSRRPGGRHPRSRRRPDPA
jgi:hypothetical protein